MVFAILGITGNVGGRAAEFLLREGKKVRGVVRDEKKADEWKKKGAEIAFATMEDEAALTEAFTDVEGVFILIPPHLRVPNARAESLKATHNMINAIKNAKVKKVVYLSSIGSHLSSGTGPILRTYDLENEMFKLAIPTASLRAASFYENTLSNFKAAKEHGQVYSMYANPDVPVAQVGTLDIGRVAANTLVQDWAGHRIIEVDGPKKYSPNEVYKIMSTLLKKDVNVITIPPENYASTFKAYGLPDDAAEGLAEMHHSIDSGYLVFGGNKTEEVHGPTTYEEFFSSQK